MFNHLPYKRQVHTNILPDARFDTSCIDENYREWCHKHCQHAWESEVILGYSSGPEGWVVIMHFESEDDALLFAISI